MTRSSDNGRRVYVVAAGIALLTLAVYLPALRNGFVNWDDGDYVFDNAHIRVFDLRLLRWAFTDASQAGLWHPLAWLSHALDYALWGLNPLGHHLTNILLHGLNTFLVVLLVQRLVMIAGDGSHPSASRDHAAIIAAGVTGALFGLHPLHVESVAWVSERKDLLFAFFYLLSIAAYLRYATGAGGEDGRTEGRRYGRGLYLASLCLFCLSLMSKPMAVTLPAVLLLLDWYPLGRLRSRASAFRAAIEKLPFVALSLVMSVVTVMSQKSVGAVVPLGEAAVQARVFIAFRSLVLYLLKMVWPVRLVPMYAYPVVPPFPSLAYVIPIVIVVALSAACIVLVRMRPVFAASWGFYLFSLLPVLGLIQVGQQYMADRFTYLSSLGPFLLVGLAGARTWEAGVLRGRRNRVIQAVIIALAGVAVCILSAMTITQIGVWRNSIALWTRVLAVEPLRLAVAYNDRGLAYAEAGQDERALEDLNASIEVNSSYAEAYLNRGVVYGRMGRCGEALDDLSRSISLRPGEVLAYVDRGRAYECLGDGRRAIEDYTRAIELRPGFDASYVLRGRLLLEKEGRSAAARDFEKACDLGSEEGCAALDELREKKL